MGKEIISIIIGVLITFLVNWLKEKYQFNINCEDNARKFIVEYLGKMDNEVIKEENIKYKDFILSIINKIEKDNLSYIEAIQTINLYNIDVVKENQKYKIEQGEKGEKEQKEIMAYKEKERIIANIFVMNSKERKYVKDYINKIEKE